jgi:NAD(P)-dependent dehydrogenase (short-subunit alcohol dehydrogenase family)
MVQYMLNPMHTALGARVLRARGNFQPPPDGSLAGQTVLVTGGTGGIGLATARMLAARGSDLVLAYGSDEARAAAAVEELQSAHGVRVRAVGGDLTTDSGRDAVVAAVFKAVDDELGGKVAAFVHAAGFFHEKLLSTHLDGARPAARRLRHSSHPLCRAGAFTSPE